MLLSIASVLKYFSEHDGKAPTAEDNTQRHKIWKIKLVVI